jgi:hypothetical protein
MISSACGEAQKTRRQNADRARRQLRKTGLQQQKDYRGKAMPAFSPG